MFSISFCLSRACFTHLISSNLSCNLCLWYWFTKIKKLMQTYIVIVSGSIVNVSTVHLKSIWHLIWRYLLKPVSGGHPVLSAHYRIPRGCPLNTGFTVLISFEQYFFFLCFGWICFISKVVKINETVRILVLPDKMSWKGKWGIAQDAQLFKPHPSNVRPTVEIITILSYWIETWVKIKFQLVQYFLTLHSDAHRAKLLKKRFVPRLVTERL